MSVTLGDCETCVGYIRRWWSVVTGVLGAQSCGVIPDAAQLFSRPTSSASCSKQTFAGAGPWGRAASSLTRSRSAYAAIVLILRALLGCWRR